MAIRVDQKVALLHVVFVLGLFVIYMINTIILAPQWDHDHRSTVLCMATVLLLLLHWWWLRCSTTDALVRWRNIVVGGIGFTLMIVTVLGSGASIEEGVVLDTRQTCWLKTAIKTGVASALWPALGFHEPFSSIAHMGALYDWVPGASNMLSTARHSIGPATPQRVCEGAVLFLQLSLGWWLSTAILYSAGEVGPRSLSFPHGPLLPPGGSVTDLPYRERRLYHSHELGALFYRQGLWWVCCGWPPVWWCGGSYWSCVSYD